MDDRHRQYSPETFWREMRHAAQEEVRAQAAETFERTWPELFAVQEPQAVIICCCFKHRCLASKCGGPHRWS